VTYPHLVRASIDGVLQALDPHSRFELKTSTPRQKGEKIEDSFTVLVLDNVTRAASVLEVISRAPRKKPEYKRERGGRKKKRLYTTSACLDCYGARAPAGRRPTDYKR